MKTTHHILIVKQSGSCTLTISHHMNIQFNLLWNKKAQWFSAFFFFLGLFSAVDEPKFLVLATIWIHTRCLSPKTFIVGSGVHMGSVDKKENIESIRTFKVWIRRVEEWQTFENTGLPVFSLSVSSWTGSGPRWDPSQRRSDVMLTRPFSLFERTQRLYVECKCL